MGGGVRGVPLKLTAQKDELSKGLTWLQVRRTTTEFPLPGYAGWAWQQAGKGGAEGGGGAGGTAP